MRPAERRAAKLLREAQRRASADQGIDLASELFGPQRAFVEDPSPFVVACCSRRAGKTYGICSKLVDAALRRPEVTVFYVTNTLKQAKRVMWTQNLKPFLRKSGLKVGNRPGDDVKLNETELSATFRNGSKIILGGANAADEIETYRGTKTPLVVLDEAQSFRPFIKYLIDDIFVPQLMDYKGSQLLMTGTPNASCHGYFYNAVHGIGDDGGWSTHGWTFLENTKLEQDPEEWLAAYLKRKNWTRDDPKVRREYLGEWVRDSDGLVFPLRDHNVVDELPDFEEEGGWSWVLGIDPGYVDATAFVVIGYHQETARAIVVESFQAERLIPDAVAARVLELSERYDFEAIVVDTGGLGKGYSQTMIEKYGIPAEAAQKTEKNLSIELLNGDLRAGVLTIYGPGNPELLHDMSLLSWNYDKIDATAHGGRKPYELVRVDDRTPDHLTDAMHYAYRKARAYLYTGEIEGPRPGTREYELAYEDELWAEQAEILSRRGRSGWALELEEGLPVDEALL